MAHFAQLDENNIVIQVIVVSNQDILDENGNESEALGIEICKNLLGENTNWVQTSYNNNFRFKYAAYGDVYDPVHDVFIPPDHYYNEEYKQVAHNEYVYNEQYGEFTPPQEYASWWYDPERKKWRPPFPKPMTTHQYTWNEDILDWVVVEGSEGTRMWVIDQNNQLTN